MSETVWIDTETTGLDPKKHDIIQIGGMIETKGMITKKFDIRMQPYDYDAIDPGALEVNGITIKELRTYQSPIEGFAQLIAILGTIPTKKEDRYQIAGWRVKFDYEFLEAFFARNGVELRPYFKYQFVDPLYTIWMLEAMGSMHFEDHHLQTVLKELGIKTKQAHDAYHDAVAARAVAVKLGEIWKSGLKNSNS